MKKLSVLLPLACAFLLAGNGLATGQGPAPAGQFRFARLNRAYDEAATAVAPIRHGPVTIRLSSPRHRLILRDHLVRLEPGAGGSHAAELTVDLMGKGWLVADVEVAGLSARFQDEVQVLPQSHTLEGRVRVARARGGYLVTPEQLPRSLPVRIRSRIATDVVNLCDRAAMLVSVDCAGLDQALSRAVVPLPPAGESYLLEDAELTPAERQRIDAYLERTRR